MQTLRLLDWKTEININNYYVFDKKHNNYIKLYFFVYYTHKKFAFCSCYTLLYTCADCWLCPYRNLLLWKQKRKLQVAKKNWLRKRDFVIRFSDRTCYLLHILTGYQFCSIFWFERWLSLFIFRYEAQTVSYFVYRQWNDRGWNGYHHLRKKSCLKLLNIIP